MSVVPTKQLQKLEWAESHVAPFTTNAVAIGTTAAEVTEFETRTETARAAMTAAVAARDAAKAATIELQTALAALDIAAAGIIKQVRAKAQTSGNPNVYALAQIPLPAVPAPVGAPGTPYGFAATLLQDGSTDVAFKCNNPAGCDGVIYRVLRRIGTGAFTEIASVGEKKFTDATIPAGTAMVTYQIQGVRSTSAGPWAQFNVNFGTGAGGAGAGAATASVSPMAIAA